MRPTRSTPALRGGPPALDGPRLRLIAVALLLGAGTFAAIAGLLPLLGTEADPTVGAEGYGSTLRTLSLAHGVLAAACLGLATFYRLRIAAAPERASGLWLTRWALLEGAALFGIVIVLMAGRLGALPAEPLWYLNYASFAVFALSVVLDLATGAGSSDG